MTKKHQTTWLRGTTTSVIDNILADVWSWLGIGIFCVGETDPEVCRFEIRGTLTDGGGSFHLLCSSTHYIVVC